MKVISFLLIFFLSTACSTNEVVATGDPISDVFFSKQNQYKQCYEESDSYKGKDKVETGTVVINFLIDSNGIVQDEKIEKTDFKDANFHACLLSMIRMLQFKPRHKIANVTQAINFLPAEK